MNTLDKKYTDLLQDILDTGVKKGDRTGTGTISVFGREIRHKMSEGFPLLTTKKMYFKGIVTELLWFLRGDTNIKYLVDNDCHIWDGDAWKNWVKRRTQGIEDTTPPGAARDFLLNNIIGTKEEFIERIKTDNEFAKRWGDLGPVYGKQWRSWDNFEFKKTFGSSDYEAKNNPIDQIANLIKDLKTNPDSRRLMVTAWNPSDLPKQVLPPCHYGFECWTRELTDIEIEKLLAHAGVEEIRKEKQDAINTQSYEKAADIRGREKALLNSIPKRAISLKWNQRSVDTFLGLPFNIASYGLLLEIIAKEVNMVPDELIGNLGDTHLYLNHIEQAKEQIGVEMTTEERNEYVFVNHVKNPKYRNNWKDYELDQQNYPRRTREPFPLPKLNITQHEGQTFSIDDLYIDNFGLENYRSHGIIKAPLSN